MLDWRAIAIKADTSIMQAIAIIDKASFCIALVINDDDQLLGVVTDGDVRRGMLRHLDLSEPVTRVMNHNPVVSSPNETRQKIIAKMRTLSLRHIPIVNSDNRVVGLETIEHLLLEPRRDNWVVLMAGGLGTRLKSLTENCPKPLLKVSSKPVLEILLENFIEYGFHQFYFAINYKGHLIQEYFGDGSRWGVKIHYICENERLGTAGALSLLPHTPQLPLFVMNADLLTKVNFQKMLDFHHEHHAMATLCVREYKQVIPYGVVQISKEDYQLVDIQEKPEHTLLVSAGIYVLSPEILNYLPVNSYYDMPDLLKTLVRHDHAVTTFPIHEYWLDIGRLEDLERAHQDYNDVFA